MSIKKFSKSGSALMVAALLASGAAGTVGTVTSLGGQVFAESVTYADGEGQKAIDDFTVEFIDESGKSIGEHTYSGLKEGAKIDVSDEIPEGYALVDASEANYEPTTMKENSVQVHVAPGKVDTTREEAEEETPVETPKEETPVTEETPKEDIPQAGEEVSMVAPVIGGILSSLGLAGAFRKRK